MGFWMSLPAADLQVIKVKLCSNIWLKFDLATVKRSAVWMEMYSESDIALLLNAKFQAAIHC